LGEEWRLYRLTQVCPGWTLAEIEESPALRNDWFIAFDKLERSTERKAEAQRGEGLLASLFGRRHR
jgi:hypothetical protein